MSSITLPASVLRTALIAFSKVINRRCTLPVLGYVKAERRNGAVHLSGTDLDLYLTYSHPIEPAPITVLAKSLASLRWAREACALLVPLEALRHAAKAASGPNPSVSIMSDQVAWSSAGDPVSMPFTPLSAKEFPELPAPPFSKVSVPADLRVAIVEAGRFASRDETRYVLNGVYLESSHGGNSCTPSVVATDGRRLYRRSAPSLAGLSSNFVLPSKAVAVLSTAPLLAHDWKLGANAKAQRVSAKAGPWTLVSKVIDGTYPNYRQVIHTDFTHWIAAVLNAAQVQYFSTSLAQFPPSQRPPIALLFHGDHLRLTCPETKSSVVIPGVRSDAPLAVLFDRVYLRDMLSCGPGTMFLLDESTPCHYAVTSGAEHVLMPYRGDIPFIVPDPQRVTLEMEWKDRRVSIAEPGAEGQPPEIAEGTVLRVIRQGLRIDSALVQFDGEKNPRPVALAGLTLLPPQPAEATAA